MVYIPLAFTETVKMFALLVRVVYLSQSEMIKESDYIYAAPKIKETWKIYKLVRRQSQKGEYNSSFFKAANGFMFRGKDMTNSCFAVMKKQETDK